MAHQFQTQSLEKALIFVIFLASRWELFLETGFETGTYALSDVNLMPRIKGTDFTQINSFAFL